jgi:hypothetical protein
MEIERVNRIYNELSQYEIQLAPDPKSMGPLYMLGVIATCRNYLNNVSRLLLETHQCRQTVQRSLTGCKTLYDIESNELLANDERVKRCPSIEDRKATVTVLLRDRYRQIQDLKAELETVDLVEKAIKLRHRELKDTMSAINAQRALMRDDIDTKSLYGDERPPAVDDSELASIMGTEALPAGIRAPDAARASRSYTESGREVDDFLKIIDEDRMELPPAEVSEVPKAALPDPEPPPAPESESVASSDSDEVDFDEILNGL